MPQTQARLLLLFGKATRLCTNLRKTSVVIGSNIDLEGVHEDMPIPTKKECCTDQMLQHWPRPSPWGHAGDQDWVPMRYLDLPLSICRLRKIEFQPLIYTVAALFTLFLSHLFLPHTNPQGACGATNCGSTGFGSQSATVPLQYWSRSLTKRAY